MRSTLTYGFLLVLMSWSLLFVADIHAKEGTASKKGTVTKEAARKKTSAARVTTTKKTGGAETRKSAPGGAGTAKPAESNGAAAGEALALITDVRYWSNPDYTRVVITLDREVRFESNQIKQHVSDANPSRIYIDLNASRLGPGVKDFSVGDGLLKTARVGQYRADVVRVVLDVENVKDYKVFPLSDPFRIIIDVKGVRPLEISRLTEQIQPAPAVAAEPKKIEPREDKPRAGARFKPGKIRRIVVDPGHGGHDPGAVGAHGTQEKNVVLAIGLNLAEKLRDELGIDVVMTRSTDVFIPLEERTAIANKVNADLFVSIHANASLNRGASGIETYYLNLAKTEKAAQLAARENGTSLEKVSLLQAILFDLMANYKLNDSAHLAEEVQKALYRKLQGHYPSTKNLGVKQGPFYVLVGATMPSILVETAFISNEAEEERLRDSSYQERAAEGVLEGIKAYISSLK